MKDPTYPDAVEPETPEFSTDKERADYFEKLAKSYGAKITMLKHVLAGTFELVEKDGHWYAVEAAPEDKTP